VKQSSLTDLMSVNWDVERRIDAALARSAERMLQKVLEDCDAIARDATVRAAAAEGISVEELEEAMLAEVDA